MDRMVHPWRPQPLSSQVTEQSRVQRLLQDVGPMKRLHVKRRRRGSRVAGRWRIALAGDGGGGHVEGRGARLIELPVGFFVQRQSQALALLSPVTEPHSDHLRVTTAG